MARLSGAVYRGAVFSRKKRNIRDCRGGKTVHISPWVDAIRAKGFCFVSRKIYFAEFHLLMTFLHLEIDRQLIIS